MLGLQLHNNKRIWLKPEVNRGYPLELVSHHQPQQSRLPQKYSRTTNWPYPNGVTHTLDFNAMFNCSCAAWQRRNPENSTLLALCDGYPPMTGGLSPQRIIHYGNQSRGYFNGGRPLWPPAVPRLAARPSQSNPRGSGPEVMKGERGHVTVKTWSFCGGGLQALQPNVMCKAFPCHYAINEYGVAAMFAVVRMT